MIGQTVLHYNIIEKLGEGGMGIVYKAHDTKLDRFVALKFLPERLVNSEQDRARFLQEAKAASALNHPNICTIHGIEEFEGKLFMVMELVDGQTLRDKRSSISFKQAIDIGIQIADGLAAAHEKGVVHRDIKPDNIMIRKDGIAQIMDFGLAKLRGVSKLTKEGSTIGTAGYMSPEQVQGQDTDHRSDIFSLGVLLYELLTGQLPFKGVHESALMYEIVNVDVEPMASIRHEIDPQLDALVLECMEKDPNERTQSAKQVAIDLKHFKRASSRQRMSKISMGPTTLSQTHETIPQKQIHAPSGSRWMPWILAGLFAVIALLGLWAPWRSVPAAQIMKFGLNLPKGESFDLIIYPAVAISPDGSRIVYRANGRLFLRNLDNLEAIPIQGTEDGGSPFFSPDGRWIGFFGGGKLKKISTGGGAPITLADAPDNRGGTWGPEGFIVFTPIATSGLMRVSEAGGLLEPVTVPDSSRKERTHRWPHFLPDGSAVIFTVGTRESPDYYEEATIESVNLKTGVRKALVSGASTAHYVETGHLLFSKSGVLYAVSFDPNRLEVLNSPSPIVEDVNGDPTTGAMHYATSRNGTFIYVAGNTEGADRSMVTFDRYGKESVFELTPKPFIEPRLSPDGKRIAMVAGSGKDFDIWIYDIARGSMSRLTFGGTNRTPTWSPDGKLVAYFSSQKGGVFVKPYDGSSDEKRLSAGLGRTYVSSWSHDGSTLILDRSTNSAQSDIYILPLTGDQKTYAYLSTEFDEYLGALSPNDKWLAYVSNESGAYQVYVQPFPGRGGKWQISTQGGSEPRWSADGKTLFYLNNTRMMAVAISTTPVFSAGQPQILFEGKPLQPVDSGVTYDVAPDGQHFISTRPNKKDNFQQITVVLNWFSELKNKISNIK